MEERKLLFQPGLVVNQEFFDYAEMQESAKNWSYILKYRLGTGPFYGHHNGVQLNNLQFGHSDCHEGLIYEGFSPKDCLTIGLLQKSNGTLIVNNQKMKAEDIIIIDDSKPFDFISSHRTVFTLVSIHKTLIEKEIPWLLDGIDKKFKDKDNIFSDTVEKEWSRVLDKENLSDTPDKIDTIEKKIINAIKSSFEGQSGEKSHLTKGELTAMEVKLFLRDSIDEDITIQSITRQFNVSYQTLETSFKSLFGMTPKHFISLLKLNEAHKDLKINNSQTTNVSDIAYKWGFSHLGRFSQDHKSLFGILPSEVLRQTPIVDY